MANQISAFFASQPEAARLPGVAAHINDFWEPRMRAFLLELLDAGETQGIDPLVISAAPLIKRPSAA
ncbi:MAG: formate dehydrogenase subunit delta [Halocynthiibacter sp.]|jgi:formate dehydrogenase subunit delta